MDRPSTSDDEAKYPWLRILLDAYEKSDRLTGAALAKGPAVACTKGCSNCCKKASIPFTEPELAGISWYVLEKLSGPIRETIKTRLKAHAATAECPFLVSDSCSIYPVRPLICRQFHVKRYPCGEDEDVEITRPEDIVSPKEVARGSGMKLLEYWEIKGKLKQERAFDRGFLAEKARQMHEYDWNIIATRMEGQESAI